MKAKVAILETLGKPLIVDEIDVPAPDFGQVLVRVHCSGICGTQLEELDARSDPYLPHLLGHEGAGVIEAIGQGVSRVSVGEHAVLHWRKGAGIESDFPKYKWHNKTIGGGLVTTFNEYALVSENRLTAIDKDIPFDIASLMGCAVTTGLGVVFREARLQPGESIAILGCGGIGLNIIQGATLVSAFPIVAFDKLEYKMEMAKDFGATHKGITGFDYDVVVECTGDSKLMEEAVCLARPGGRIIFIGLPHGDMSTTLEIPGIRKHFTNKRITLSKGGQTLPNEDIPHYLGLWEAGNLKLEELITHRYNLNDINKAIDQLRTGDCGRIIVEMP